MDEKMRATSDACDDVGTADDPTLVSSIIGVIAIGRSQFILGRLAVAFTEEQRKEMIERTGWA
jgi:hypothetical protein